MSSSHQSSFSSGFHTVQHDFGSLNNSPKNFSITLFSSNKKAERVSQQSSVRSHFSTTLVAPLNLRGPWQVRLKELTLRNEQSHQFVLEIWLKSNDTLLERRMLPRKVYENLWDIYEEFFNYRSTVSVTYQVTLYTHVDLAAEVFQPDCLKRTVRWNKGKAWFWIVEPFNFGDKANLLFDEAPTTILRVWERMAERLCVITHMTNGHMTEMTLSLYNQFMYKGGKVPSFLLWDNYRKAHKDGTIPSRYSMTIVTSKWNKGHELPILVTPNKKLRFKDNGAFCAIVTKKMASFMKIGDMAPYVKMIPVENADHLVLVASYSGDRDIPNYTYSRSESRSELRQRVTSSLITSTEIDPTQETMKMNLINGMYASLKDKWGNERLRVDSPSYTLHMSSEHMHELVDPVPLQRLKMDMFDVHVEELEVKNKEFVANMVLKPTTPGNTVAELARNKLVDFVYIPRDHEFFIYRDNRRGFKSLAESHGVSKMTIALRSVERPDKTPWFHTGFTLVSPKQC